MKRLILITTLLFTVFAFASSASAIGIRGALVLSNSNLALSNGGSESTDLDLHYGIEIDASFPINPMMEILAGLTLYLPASGPELASDEKVGFMPISVAAKFNIPGVGVTGMNPYAGVGLNYTTWSFEPDWFGEDATPGLGYYGFVGAAFGNLFGELGYTIMTATVFDGDLKLESRGVYVKGGMILGI